uniref:Uncharacterized protein n=1 Tax=Cucumis melo TaxID=3656 RepID=A0A9I9E829_CUCME
MKKQIISSKKISQLNLFNTFTIDPLIVFTGRHYYLKSSLKLGILSFFNILPIDKEVESFLILIFNHHCRRLHLFLISFPLHSLDLPNTFSNSSLYPSRRYYNFLANAVSRFGMADFRRN